MNRRRFLALLVGAPLAAAAAVAVEETPAAAAVAAPALPVFPGVRFHLPACARRNGKAAHAEFLEAAYNELLASDPVIASLRAKYAR